MKDQDWIELTNRPTQAVTSSHSQFTKQVIHFLNSRVMTPDRKVSQRLSSTVSSSHRRHISRHHFNDLQLLTSSESSSSLELCSSSNTSHASHYAEEEEKASRVTIFVTHNSQRNNMNRKRGRIRNGCRTLSQQHPFSTSTRKPLLPLKIPITNNPDVMMTNKLVCKHIFLFLVLCILIVDCSSVKTSLRTSNHPAQRHQHQQSSFNNPKRFAEESVVVNDDAGDDDSDDDNSLSSSREVGTIVPSTSKTPRFLFNFSSANPPSKSLIGKLDVLLFSLTTVSFSDLFFSLRFFPYKEKVYIR